MIARGRTSPREQQSRRGVEAVLIRARMLQRRRAVFEVQSLCSLVRSAAAWRSMTAKA
jgi:hypothetical protein